MTKSAPASRPPRALLQPVAPPGRSDRLAATSEAIAQTWAEVRLRTRLRRLYREHIREIDRLVWALEELNAAGKESPPVYLRERLVSLCSRLPVESELEALSSVQALLDGLFEVQTRLLRWRSPAPDDADDDSTDVGVTDSPNLRSA